MSTHFNISLPSYGKCKLESRGSLRRFCYYSAKACKFANHKLKLGSYNFKRGLALIVHCIKLSSNTKFSSVIIIVIRCYFKKWLIKMDSPFIESGFFKPRMPSIADKRTSVHRRAQSAVSTPAGVSVSVLINSK